MTSQIAERTEIFSIFPSAVTRFSKSRFLRVLATCGAQVAVHHGLGYVISEAKYWKKEVSPCRVWRGKDQVFSQAAGHILIYYPITPKLGPGYLAKTRCVLYVAIAHPILLGLTYAETP